MIIAKIAGSNSHIDYFARVIDSLDVEIPPDPGDHGFGQFVSMELEGERAVGVIYNSRLINPEYSNFGPRLNPKPAAEIFSPDYLNEQGVLISIALLGTFSAVGDPIHGIPRYSIPAGHDVHLLDSDAVNSFHTDQNGGVQIRYFSQVLAHSGSLGVPLLETIIDRLRSSFSASEQAKLEVLRDSLKWPSTFASVKQ